MFVLRALLFFLGSATPACALSVAPAAVELTPGEATRVELVFAAGSLAPAILEFSIVERTASGPEETRKPPEDSPVKIYPPQIMIPAGKSAVITLALDLAVRGNGSRSFYLVAEELPVTSRHNGLASGLRFLTRLHVPVHVDFGGAPKLRAHIEPGRNILAIRNDGTRYIRFSDLTVTVRLKGSSRRIRIPGQKLAPLAGSDAILPGRTVSIPLDGLGVEAPAESAVIEPPL
ncbi:MAG: hypothetical protein ACLFV8_02175 [Alphaproteobacteria bacterium]